MENKTLIERIEQIEEDKEFRNDIIKIILLILFGIVIGYILGWTDGWLAGIKMIMHQIGAPV